MNKFTKLVTEIGKLWSKYGNSYLTGIQNTLILALAATAIGCVIGFACGILNTIPCSKNDPLPKRILLKLVRIIVRVYVEVFRGTPMVLQAVFIYYGLPYFTDNALKFTNMWVAALVVVSVNTGAYMAESVRGGIISIDPGQTEGAKAIGMTHVQTMMNVILPQALRNIMPQIGNNFIINVKDTSDVHHRLPRFLRCPPRCRGCQLSVRPLCHGGNDWLPVHDPHGLLPTAVGGEEAGWQQRL